MSFAENPKTMLCTCRKFDPKYIDKNYQHILSGGLRIISYGKLEKHCPKSPKYRHPANISWQEAKTQTDIGLNEYIGKLKVLAFVIFLNGKTK